MRAQLQSRHTKIISFSGIDGAGKSTQIERLCASLRQTGLSVRVVCFWDQVARLTRFRETAGHAVFGGDTGVGTPSAPICRRDKNVRSWIMTAIRLFLYSLDAISLRMLVKRAQDSGADLLIFDRFIYDELANLELGRWMMRAYARAIVGFVPRPDISYLLDADPVAARARKPEYPLGFLDFNRKSYLALSNLVCRFQVIAPLKADDVEQEVLQLAINALSLVPAQNIEALGAQAGFVR
jgi:thymidylate kinase